MQLVSQRDSLKDAAFRMLDALSIAFAHWLASAIWSMGFDRGRMMASACVIIAYYLCAEITGMYRSWRSVGVERELAAFFTTWLASLGTALLAAFVLAFPLEEPRVYYVTWGVLGAIVGVTYRLCVRGFLRLARSYGYNARGFAIVGVNELGFRLARNVAGAPDLGLRLVGFYDDREDERLPEVPAEFAKNCGAIDDLVQRAKNHEIGVVYITLPMRAEDRIHNILMQLSDSTASVYIVPDFFVFELLHSRWTNIGGLPTVSIYENPLYGVSGVVKRMLDLGLAIGLLAVLAIPMVVIAGLVKYTSPGPVFFRQRRYGLDGRDFHIWKFRTMRVCEDDSHLVQATKDDDRVTAIGRFLRRTSLDELPQLFNVLIGSMSLVGPRPHANAHNESYRSLIQGYMLRHKVKPGITGLAQVHGYRGETDTLEKMQRRVEYDHRYIREWSLLLDLQILFRTLSIVWSGKNAY